jgi:hypothetical protein
MRLNAYQDRPTEKAPARILRVGHRPVAQLVPFRRARKHASSLRNHTYGDAMSHYLAEPLPFPAQRPQGYEPLDDEPVFDAARHLRIEMPERVIPLTEFGYSDEQIAQCPTGFGATSVFRILSDEGAACMLDVARKLEAFTTSNPRIARNVRGGAYRSTFLHDLCHCPELTDAMSAISGIPLLPHSLPHQLGHLNFAPFEVGENVDKWHVDTLRIDFVMFVTDPNTVEGGEFQYYLGTKEEVAALRKAGRPLDPSKIVSPAMPGPGHAVLQQGNMVVHRAKGLAAPGERITMVNGYVPRDIAFPDFSRFDQLALVDPKDVAASEYARHATWMARERLTARLVDFTFSDDTAAMADEFEEFARSMAATAQQLRNAGKADIEHFGDG